MCFFLLRKRRKTHLQYQINSPFLALGKSAIILSKNTRTVVARIRTSPLGLLLPAVVFPASDVLRAKGRRPGERNFATADLGLGNPSILLVVCFGPRAWAPPPRGLVWPPPGLVWRPPPPGSVWPLPPRPLIMVTGWSPPARALRQRACRSPCRCGSRVSASPQNSHVLAAHATFLWDTDDEESVGDVLSIYAGFAQPAHSSTLASATT
jgi:hypothetical protein